MGWVHLSHRSSGECGAVTIYHTKAIIIIWSIHRMSCHEIDVYRHNISQMLMISMIWADTHLRMVCWSFCFTEMVWPELPLQKLTCASRIVCAYRRNIWVYQHIFTYHMVSILMLILEAPFLRACLFHMICEFAPHGAYTPPSLHIKLLQGGFHKIIYRNAHIICE